MEIFNFTENSDDNKAIFYITNDNDIVESKADAEMSGWAIAEIIVHGMYVGSLKDMRQNAMDLYQAAAVA